MAVQKITKQLRQKAQKWARFLVFLPGVEAVFLSGSLAKGKATQKSDIDFLIVARRGQIFTARFFVNLVLTLFRQLANNEKNHAGKICPNHFITTQDLEIKEKDVYAADLFSQNVFLAGNFSVWTAFVKDNKAWIELLGYRFQNISTKQTKPLKKEKINWFLAQLESWLKRFQIKKIEKTRKNLPKEAKVILTDQEIRLHPKPKNKYFLSKNA